MFSELFSFYRDRAGGSPDFFFLSTVTVQVAPDVHVCVILYMWRPVGRKRRVGTLSKDNFVSGVIIANFIGSSFSNVNGIQTEGSERLNVEAP